MTSVQEQTLTFFPKTIGIASFLVIASPWIVRTLIEYTQLIIQMAPQMTQWKMFSNIQLTPLDELVR